MRQFFTGGDAAYAQLAQRAVRSCVVFHDQELPPGSVPPRGKVGFSIKADQSADLLVERVVAYHGHSAAVAAWLAAGVLHFPTFASLRDWIRTQLAPCYGMGMASSPTRAAAQAALPAPGSQTQALARRASGVQLPPGAVVLGRDAESGGLIGLSPAARQLSLYLIGKPGTGKSTLLRTVAYQDMVNGDGLCFPDPHEDAVNDLLAHIPSHRLSDLIVWDPTNRRYPFGLNPFFCGDEADIDRLADNFLAVLGSLAEFHTTFQSAPRMKTVLKNLAIACLANQGSTLADTPEFLTNRAFRQGFYPALAQSYPQVLRFWQRFDTRPEREQRELTDSSLNKLERFQIDRTMRGIFGQARTAIDFRAAMDAGKIILVKLSSQRLGDDNAAFLGAFIVWEILQAALSRSDTPRAQRRQFHLFADEFQTFMTSAFPKLIEQARKFGVDVAVAHQARGQLDEQTRKTTLAVNNKVVFGVSGEDARELVSEFAISIPEPVITGYKPRYAAATNVLEHLERNGHEQHAVVDVVRKLRGRLDKVFEFFSHLVAKMDESVRFRFGVYVPQPGAPDRYRSGATFKEIEHGIRERIDEVLYTAMQGNGSPSQSVLRRQVSQYFTTSLYSRAFPADVLQIFDALRSLFARHNAWGEEEMNRLLSRSDNRAVHIEDGTRIGYSGDPSIPKGIWLAAMICCHAEYQIAAYVAALARLLAQWPALAQTGQLDPIYDRPRLHSDVQLEMANGLVTLPPMTARCILIQGGQRSEHTLHISQPTYHGHTVDARQLDHSAQQYGTPAEQVERDIEARLTMQSSSAIMNHISDATAASYFAHEDGLFSPHASPEGFTDASIQGDDDDFWQDT